MCQNQAMSDSPELIARLVGAVSASEAAQVAAQRLVSYRNLVVREAFAAGITTIDIAALTGLSRPRVYEILHLPDDDDEGFDYASFYEELEDMWAVAVHDWEQHGKRGDPADFFPLGEAVNEAL